jgi:phospholipid/cholesterol/gamma-HCH transport system substrate-binding protein
VRHEIKVGILGIFSIGLLIWGYNFLKGKNIFSNDLVVTARFDAVDGLNIAAPVSIRGMQVGAVTNITPTADYNAVIVEFNLKNTVRVPKDAKASLIQPSLMGGKELGLIFSGDCGSNCLSSGDELVGSVPGMLDGVLETAQPYMDKMDSLVSVVSNFTQGEDSNLKGTIKELGHTVVNVRKLTGLVNGLVARSSNNIDATVKNIDAITANIKANNEEITALLKNVNGLTEQLNSADLKGTVDVAKEMMTSVNSTVGGLDGTMAEVNKALKNITILTDLASQDGVMNALFNDANFKGEIDNMVDNLNLLLQDIRIHPERYRTVLSGKYKPYVKPEEDPKLNKKKKK